MRAFSLLGFLRKELLGPFMYLFGREVFLVGGEVPFVPERVRREFPFLTANGANGTYDTNAASRRS
jgi:hypothetical protein